MALEGLYPMGVFESITGRPYSLDGGCNQPFGPQHRAIIYDWSIRRYRYVIMQSLATSRDRVAPTDPDATIAHEGPQALGFKPVKRSATADLLERVVAVLEERTLNSTQLASSTGESTARIRGLIRNHPEGFEVVARGLYGNVYGLPGHCYADPVYHGSMRAIVDYLRQHGPATAPEICAALGIAYDTFTNARKGNPEAIKCVEKVRTEQNNNRQVQIWALV